GEEEPPVPPVGPFPVGIELGSGDASEDGWGSLIHPKALTAFIADVERAIIEQQHVARVGALDLLEGVPAPG
ncbi:MAG TPA: hypothetical protein VD931_18375, partial [Baekduia sp.]|nr:hypothetical protein [Baekduia sp.]